jgi:hypothetical protein
MLWNTFNYTNPDNLIKEIPFSGSMFEYVLCVIITFG